MSPLPLSLSEVIREDAVALADEWRLRCASDPTVLAPSDPPIAVSVVTAIADSLASGYSLLEGLPPHCERIFQMFASAVGSVERAIPQLACLRQVLSPLALRSQQDEPQEGQQAQGLLHLAVDRAIDVTVSHLVARLQDDVFIDHLTRLRNRRALERDLTTEAARASRYGRSLSLVIVDLDGLKTINDVEGHTAGDRSLCSLALALTNSGRLGDTAYRLGGDEFVFLLPETSDADIEVIVERVANAGAPSFSWGAASYPENVEQPHDLLDAADRQLLARRQLHRGMAE